MSAVARQFGKFVQAGHRGAQRADQRRADAHDHILAIGDRRQTPEGFGQACAAGALGRVEQDIACHDGHGLENSGLGGLLMPSILIRSQDSRFTPGSSQA